MSTRSCIAKPDGDAWKGRYHHSDGYPTGMGRSLIDMFHGYFAGDLDAMVAYLIDSEPVGWSFILGTDLSIGPQWLEWDAYPKDDDGFADFSKIGPQSFTARGEVPFHDEDGTGDWIRPGDDTDTEWVYVLTPMGIFIGVGTQTPEWMVAWDDVDYRTKLLDIQTEVSDRSRDSFDLELTGS